MRKYLALALAGALAFGVVTFATADESIQTIETKITPKKLDKKKFKGVKLFTDVETFSANETEQPPKAYRTVVDFAKNMRFNTKAAPNCKVNEAGLENTSTEQAKQACGKKSIVSLKGSKAEVIIDTGTGVTKLPILVTAFNGKKKNTIYLHSRAQTVPITSVLVGKLKKSKAPYGKKLDVTIPPLAAGAISNFEVVVKKGTYVQARCKSKTNKFRATTFYHDHPKTVDEFTSKCTQKKAKKKRGKKGRR